MRIKKGLKTGEVFVFLFLALLSFVILVPFVYLFTSSLKTNAQYFKIPIEWIPSPALWSNYYYVFVDLKFYVYMWNSTFLAASSVVLSVLSSSLIAYGFARFRFPYRNAMFIVVIATMMLPSQVSMIPLFIYFKSIGWLDSYKPLLVPQLFGSAYLIFLIRQFYITLPREVDEAATIDGCGYLRIWWHVIMPQAKPVLVVSALFVFLASWKDVFGPLIYLSDRSAYPLAVGLLYFTSPTSNAYTLILVAIVIALIPTLLFFILSQKYLNKGVNIANLK
ncbi:carbohydrate ABC transporter permease [Paenibacillus mendelii]|uniref:Carbohydrate ABC transporter permease n=1 Tax=Paenibacillus mendelii TaxID=206163 RepID=A0ABV6J2N8_9BACL|nr:carbohydrate ABC transporter permease [Paenibacillus mendelii]MCQ6559244.1 carbohydrate ABC transporter permease [Paenibacillus mendelii]